MLLPLRKGFCFLLCGLHTVQTVVLHDLLHATIWGSYSFQPSLPKAFWNGSPSKRDVFHHRMLNMFTSSAHQVLDLPLPQICEIS